MSWERAGAIAGIIGAIITGAGLIASGWQPTLFGGRNDRFYCQQDADTSRGGSVWTVVYRNDKGAQPWLKMVNSFGDGWNTQKRCNEIADRLEGFRNDGLTQLTYRDDSDTPTQAVICAKTKLSGDNCPVLVTLIPGADGYESLRKITEALRNGTTVDQSSGSRLTTSTFSSTINLSGLLADEDLKAAGK
ncbi:COP23 domain-containing protein [Argonema galeatum]|uniref:COP23 domain-containing protein n=1 Tax=Argonema galeatum TaxID=2942762 RepID=UPI0020119A2E|nr:COP23 domain-containing protein [Argonema galeatum]MCL1464248.1 COP23 domain-containing protein [Argonema galeatum A003/A1]